MSRRNKKKKEESGEHNEWLQTYADTITLVLTFFVLLYSYSTIDAIKFQRVSDALQSVLSGKTSNSIIEMHDPGEVPIVGTHIDMGTKQSGQNEKDAMYEKIKGFIEKSKLKDTVSIRKDAKGVVMELNDNVLFDSARAQIKDSSRSILDKINSLIVSIPNEVIVEGHTDNRSIHNAEFASNWELSTQRAVNVLKYFVQVKGQNPKKFQAAGYGEYRPIASNNTDKGRAKNRRVSILITAKEKEKK